jgi:hypothetical protein
MVVASLREATEYYRGLLDQFTEDDSDELTVEEADL